MKNIQIFEPAMCCDTGLCGVSVDPELLRISTVLNSLKRNGITIERYNLSSSPQVFVTNKVANTYINEKGVDGLPLILVDNEIAFCGRYPTNEEFIDILNIPKSYLEERKVLKVTRSKKSNCCCSDGDCC